MTYADFVSWCIDQDIDPNSEVPMFFDDGEGKRTVINDFWVDAETQGIVFGV